MRTQKLLDTVFRVIPERIRVSIMRYARRRRDFYSGISEIRLRSHGYSTLVISGENVILDERVSPGELVLIFERITNGSLNAYEADIARGYLSLPHGIRVGICGYSEVSSLVFRLPTYTYPDAYDLYRDFITGGGGMLIYSVPGAGKTTALRALAAEISKRSSRRVVIVDERREFSYEDYLDASVDILTGVDKAEGIEIAERTLNAEVIVVDEIANEAECDALLRVGRGGIPLIASAHAAEASELFRKRSVVPLIDEGYFKSFVRLYREGGSYLREVSFI